MVRFTNPPPTVSPTSIRVPSESAQPNERPRDVPSRLDVSKMDRIIATYMRTPYQRGGAGSLGLDCSGFVYVVYRDYDGTRLPLTVQSLYRLEDRVTSDDLSYGDLVFFRHDGRKVSHVGIYLGDGKFVHASESHGVTIDNLSADFYSANYAGARRIK